MAPQTVFARHEIKYLVTRDEKSRIIAAMQGRMRPDEYGRSTICSVYYDTPTKMLIRRSIESPIYKEKLRLRSYCTASDGDTVFVEIKKKFKSTVYKRRVGVELHSAEAWLSASLSPPRTGIRPDKSQIMNEIDFFLSRYDGLAPSIFISAEREAFYAVDDREFRITFDDNILWRNTDLTLSAGIGGDTLLPDGMVLMELKAGGAFPLWICHLLSDEGIYKTKFSKYGTAYKNLYAAEYLHLHNEGEHSHDINLQGAF